MKFPYKLQVDTRKSNGQEDLIIDWFIIQKISKVPGIIRQEFYSENDKRIYLFGRHKDDLNNGVQVFVHLYNLPGHQVEFEERVNSYLKNKGGFLLTNKKKPLSSYLQIIDSGFEVFKNHCFQVKDGRSRKRIVHVYEKVDKGIVIVYSLDDNKFLENTFFQNFNKACKLES